MAQETVLVPDIGGSDAAEVVEVLVSVGDVIEVDQGLLVLESDKASMEIPSSVAGTVLEVLAKEGDELGEGAAVAIIEVAGESATPATPAEVAPDAPSGAADSGGDSEEGEGDATDAPTPDSEAPLADDSAQAADAQPGAKTVAIDVPVPDIGTDEPVDLIEIAVAVGDSVAEGDTLVVLETDKASMEVPSPSSGVVTALHVAEGQQVKQGGVLLVLEVVTSGAAASAAASTTTSAPASAATSAATAAAIGAKNVEESGAARGAVTPPAASSPKTGSAATAGDDVSGAGAAAKGVYAGPAVRRLAREFGVPLGLVTSSGPRGRILKEDLHQYVQRALAAAADDASAGAGIPLIPEVDFAAYGPVDVVQRSRIDKLTAANMQRNWLNVPHVTQFDDADITEMEAFRKSLKAEAEQRNTRLTPLPFLLKACAVALKHHEKINASLSDGGSTLTYKRYVHIGMAVDTPAGLMVPVIRDVDRKTLWELAEEVLELAGKARDRKLKPAEMQGAGFTVSSLGSIGGRGFTPIVNAPEVAILGVSRADTLPVWDGAAFQPRLQLPLALSYDHRVVNGGDAGRFLTELCQLLGDIRKLLL